jgi:hypothetical protein
MKLYYVLQVDLKGSSDILAPTQDRARISQVLENLFRFFLENEGVPEEMCMWAGDGGFALIETEAHAASTALRVADWLAPYAKTFLSPEYLGNAFLPPLALRLSIGRVEAESPPSAAGRRRLSNMTGWALSLLLKHERDFGMAEQISIWEEVWNELTQQEKKRFTKRADLVRGKTVYDAPPRSRPSPELACLMAKDKIDKKTLEWLVPEIQAIREDPTHSLRDLIETVFTVDELLQEIVSHISATLTAWAPENTTFRIAYARPAGKDVVISQDAVASRSPDSHYHAIPLEGRFTASLAFSEKRLVYVANTSDELKKPAAEREFNLTHDEQDVRTLASIMCVPVKTVVANKIHGVNGVICIDTASEGFFVKPRAEAIARLLEGLLTELAIAEQFNELLQLVPNPVSKKKGRTK